MKRPEHKHHCNPRWPQETEATGQKEMPEDQLIVASWRRKEPEQMRQGEEKVEAASSLKLKSTQVQILSFVHYFICSC